MDLLIFWYTVFYIVTTRKQSLRRLCFYTCLSVILFTGWGACMVARGACVVARGHVWLLGGCVVAGGHAWLQGGVSGCGGGMRGIWRDTVNERAVRILLECIFVQFAAADFLRVWKGNGNYTGSRFGYNEHSAIRGRRADSLHLFIRCKRNPVYMDIPLFHVFYWYRNITVVLKQTTSSLFEKFKVRIFHTLSCPPLDTFMDGQQGQFERNSTIEFHC